MTPVRVGTQTVTREGLPLLVGEVGINANGDRDLALSMMQLLSRASWHCVKFQKRDLREDGEGCYRRAFLNQSRPSPWGKTQRAQKRGLEFTVEDYQAFTVAARDLGLTWFASPWDVPSVHLLAELGVSLFKVPSIMLRAPRVLDAIATYRKPVIVSTGLASWDLVDRAVEIFRSHPLVLLHCVGAYPCPPASMDLGRIPELLERYPGVPIGYSGHEQGIWPTLVAYLLGACVIERHLTIDQTIYGSDQSSALLPGECHLLGTLLHLPRVSLRELLGPAFPSLSPKGVLTVEAPILQKFRECLAALEED